MGGKKNISRCSVLSRSPSNAKDLCDMDETSLKLPANKLLCMSFQLTNIAELEKGVQKSFVARAVNLSSRW